jgi:uncharacterized membrane protein YiaA
MIILFIVLLVIGFLLFVVGFFNDCLPVLAMGSFMIGIALTIAVFDSETCSTPSAIDVYRGKTTLEITYRDSIPVDTVVVFKKK